MRTEAHARAERGFRCFNRAAAACRTRTCTTRRSSRASGRRSSPTAASPETSVWVEGQRRWVTLKGCVRTRAEADALERLVRGIDDVEAVIDELVVKKR